MVEGDGACTGGGGLQVTRDSCSSSSLILLCIESTSPGDEVTEVDGRDCRSTNVETLLPRLPTDTISVEEASSDFGKMLAVEGCFGGPGQGLSYMHAVGVRERMQWLQGNSLSHFILRLRQSVQDLVDDE